MPSLRQTETNNIDHPLDCVEEVLASHNWVFSRMGEDELMVEVQGDHCEYRVFFVWDKNIGTLQFCCQYDFKIHENNKSKGIQAISDINEQLWVGHFSLPKATLTPTFRYTCILRGGNVETAFEQMRDLVDISLSQCEDHYPLFALLKAPKAIANDVMSLATMESAGNA